MRRRHRRIRRKRHNAPSKEKMLELKAVAESVGLKANIGG